MLAGVKKTLGLDHNEKQLKGIRPLVKRVNEAQAILKKEHENDSDEDFLSFARQKTEEYKKTVQEKLQKVKEKYKDVLGEGHVDQIKEFNKNVQIERQKILDEILPEAYALVRETSKRVLKAPSDGNPMEHFDVQVMGGIALHWGRITEMATGEGKTLVATLPAYLNALTGEGVHIVTVNEYLAQRDARWMGSLYKALGLTVGMNLSENGYKLFGSSLEPEVMELVEERRELEEKIKKIESGADLDEFLQEVDKDISEGRTKSKSQVRINQLEHLNKLIEEINEKIGGKSELTITRLENQTEALKKQAYQADITYGTNNEFGFDYLRDNMKHDLEEKVQRGHHYCILDEVDSILIDEARTPLIISSPVDQKDVPVKQYTDMNPKIKEVVEKQKGLIDRKSKQVRELSEMHKDYSEKDRRNRITSDLAGKIQQYSAKIYELNPGALSQKAKKDKTFKALYKTFDQTYFEKPKPKRVRKSPKPRVAKKPSKPKTVKNPEPKPWRQRLFGFMYSKKPSPKPLRGAKKAQFEYLEKELNCTLNQYETFSSSRRRKKQISGIETKLGNLLLQIYKGNSKNELIKKDLKINKLFKEVFEDQWYEDALDKNRSDDKELFFVLSEKEHWISLTNKGWDKVYGKRFKIPHFVDRDEEWNKIDRMKISPEEKEKRKKKVEEDYLARLDKVNAVDKLLKAHVFFEKNVHYIVADGQVLIVDESTGRIMPSRRYSDGLHEAIESKEGVEIKQASQTLANITYQNYFRMYSKMAGMTGTAETEKEEFLKIYGMDTVVIPTNKPLQRKEHNDVVYLTERAKFNAALKDIIERHERGQPILVGTLSVEKSEQLAEALKKYGLEEDKDFSILNASRTLDKAANMQKKISSESEIVKRAGRLGAITISTNMAGRGTDIVLGGTIESLVQDMKKEAESMPNKEKDYVAKFLPELLKDKEFLEENPEFKDFENIADYGKALEKIAYCKANKRKEEIVKLGGLKVIGTERHEARRIDNQLRGRAGRQGDPGESIFYLSLEDDLLRLFGGERLKGVFIKLGIKEDEPIEHKFLTKAIKNAQTRVEETHFASRKYVLDLDDTNDHVRRTVYRNRDVILGEKNFDDYLLSKAQGILETIVEKHTDPQKFAEEWNWAGLEQDIYQMFGIEVPQEDKKNLNWEQLKEKLHNAVVEKYENRHKPAVDYQLRGWVRAKIAKTKESYKKAMESLDKEYLIGDERKSRIKQFNEEYKRIVSGVKETAKENKELRADVERFVKTQLTNRDRNVSLAILDEKWRCFLSQADMLKEGINLRGYGQKNPVVEYRKSSFGMFDDFTDDVDEEITRYVFKAPVE